METKYDPTLWGSETDLGRRLFIYNYTMRGDELSGWELAKTVVVPHEHEVIEKTYLWKRAKDELIQVSIIETPDWSAAQQYLKMQLDHCMHPQLPRGTGETARIGDVQYAGLGKASLVASLLFSRGNLQVNLRSAGKKIVNVSRVARDVDDRFAKPPVKRGSKAQTFKTMKPNMMSAKKGKKIVILDQLPEPVARSGWLRVEVPDGEIRREGDALYYTPDSAGRKKTIQIVNVNIEE